MSVTVFKQKLWSKKIQTDLDTLTGLRTHSDYEFESEIHGGDRLVITGTVDPTIKTYVPGVDIDIESVDGVGQELVIDQFKYFTQYLDNVDKVQSLPGVFKTVAEQCAKKLHEAGDAYVASIIKAAADATGSTIKASAAFVPTKANVVEKIEEGLQALYEANVSPTTEFYGEVSPRMYSFLRQSLTELSTNNPELLKKGAVGRYNNVLVSVENLLPVNGTSRYNIIRTGKAVAFAGQIDTIKAVEKERGFGDILKGLYVFGAKVVRPEQIYILKETDSRLSA
jgi:hypothetical protein